MAGVSVFCKEERRDDWKKADTEDTVSPCTLSEDLEDLERNRRNDSDVGAAERLSSLERKKRAVLKFIGSCRYLAFRKRLYGKPAVVLLRLAIFFGLSAFIVETSVALLTDSHQSIILDIPTPKVLSLPTDLDRVTP